MTATIPDSVRSEVTSLLTNYVVSDNGCWLWQGYMDANGYGRVNVKGALDRRGRRSNHQWVHRISYELHKGEIPERYEIDHTCTVTRCVNPDHLDAVTRAQHIARTHERLGIHERHLMAARMRVIGATYKEIADALGYANKGSAASAVLGAIEKGLVQADDVPTAPRLGHIEREEIRDLYALGIPQTVLAEIYRIDSSQVSRICSGRSSSHRYDKEEDQ